MQGSLLASSSLSDIFVLAFLLPVTASQLKELLQKTGVEIAVVIA